jgi:hypothetical protein
MTGRHLHLVAAHDERATCGLLDVVEADTVDPATIPAETLAKPTLGAVRRRLGIDGWCDEARIAFAYELVCEARRRILIDELEGVLRFMAAGATSDQALARLTRLVAS